MGEIDIRWTEPGRYWLQDGQGAEMDCGWCADEDELRAAIDEAVAQGDGEKSWAGWYAARDPESAPACPHCAGAPVAQESTVCAECSPTEQVDGCELCESITISHHDEHGFADEMVCDLGDDYADLVRDDYAHADYGDGDWLVEVRWTARDGHGCEIASGTVELRGETEEPPCPEADEHAWTRKHEGGCDSNPGVWSLGGTTMTFAAHCRHCGMSREQTVYGSQRDPGQADTTTYGDPDPDWVAEYYPEED